MILEDSSVCLPTRILNNSFGVQNFVLGLKRKGRREPEKLVLSACLKNTVFSSIRI